MDNKIHFVALIAPDLDRDILLNWMFHYHSLKLDTYTAFIHKDLCNDNNKWLVSALQKHGFRVTYVHGAFGDCDLRVNVMNVFAMSIPDNDYIMSADSDEFQQWPNDDVRTPLLNGSVDVIKGELIDKFSDTLKEYDGSESLQEIYPYSAKGLDMQIDPEYKTNLQKICIAKNKLPVCFKGSHDFNSSIPNKKLGSNLIARSGIRVHHYRWRDTLLKRLSGKEYITNKHAVLIIEAFKNKELVNA